MQVNKDYPGSAPNGHTKHCLRHIDPDQGLTMPRKRPSSCLPSVDSSDHSSSRDFRSSESMAIIKAPVNPPAKAPVKASIKSSATPNVHNTLPPSNVAIIVHPVPEKNQTEPKSTTAKPSQAYLIIQGKLLPCRLDDIKNISFAWLTDSSRDIVERSLDCKFYAIQRTPDSGLLLSAVRAEGYSSSIVEDNGAQFLNKWVSKVLEGEPIQMSIYVSIIANFRRTKSGSMGS